MKDYEVVEIKNHNMLMDYFGDQEKTDRWKTVYTNELETYPLKSKLEMINLPFHFTSKKGEEITQFAEDVTEDDIVTSIDSTKISVLLPLDDRFQLYPVRYTAFSHIQERSGITGSSISSLKERRRAKEIAPEIRCQCINEGLSLYQDKTLCLLRDGKVSALLSGDEADYAIMPVIRLLKILEAELSASYSNYSFVSARTSHEITEVLYDINDKTLEKNIINVLSSNGELINDVKVQLRLTTSDVGKCAARLTPMFYSEGKLLTFGKALSVEHKGGSKAMSCFTDTAHMCMAKFRESLEILQHMMNVKITYPADCLKAVYEALKLTGYAQYLKIATERITQEHTAGCSAYDIYWYLNEILCMQEEDMKKKGTPVNLFQSIKSQETVAAVLFMDLKQFDN